MTNASAGFARMPPRFQKSAGKEFLATKIAREVFAARVDLVVPVVPAVLAGWAEADSMIVARLYRHTPLACKVVSRLSGGEKLKREVCHDTHPTLGRRRSYAATLDAPAEEMRSSPAMWAANGKVAKSVKPLTAK